MPIPKGLFKKTVVGVAKEKEERLKAKTEAIRKEYEDNPKKRFELKTEALPGCGKFDKAKENIEATFQGKLQFSGTKPR